MSKVGTVNTTKSVIVSNNQRIYPVASSKTVVINRSIPGMHGSSHIRSSSEHVSRSSLGHSFASPGSQTNVTSVGVKNIKDGRERERKDLQDLNGRFADYIDKVRFLEAQNKKLASELAALRDQWGKETERIKAMYDAELNQLRKLLSEGEHNKAELEVRVSSLEDQIAELNTLLNQANMHHVEDRDTINKLNQQMADFEGEISLLRRRLTSMEEERDRDKREIQRLRDEVSRLRTDLDQETFNHINAENAAQSLRDELEFLKQVHQSELKELAALAYRDTTSENRSYWKSEMSQALKDMQKEYDSKMDHLKSEMESHYHLKLQDSRTNNTRENIELTHIREENSRMKSLVAELRGRISDLEARNAALDRELEDLRREFEDERREWELEKNRLRTDLHSCQNELEGVLHEMQILLDAKLSLELEIAAYRKLLEGEEKRISNVTTINKVLSSSIHSNESEIRPMLPFESTSYEKSEKQKIPTVVKGEMSARTAYQRTAKGNVSIQQCSSDGKFILLENTGKKKENISNWRIIRTIDSGRQIVRFNIPDNTHLEAEGQTKLIKIWARAHKPAGSSDLECNESTWGVGNNVQTVLLNQEGEERATHTQNTVYQTK